MVNGGVLYCYGNKWFSIFDYGVNMIDRHLESMILRERWGTKRLAQEILEKLSLESKERLFRIFQLKESELLALKNKARYSII